MRKIFRIADNKYSKIKNTIDKSVEEAVSHLILSPDSIVYEYYYDYRDIDREVLKSYRHITDSIKKFLKILKMRYTFKLGKKILIKNEYYPQINSRAPNKENVHYSCIILY